MVSSTVTLSTVMYKPFITCCKCVMPQVVLRYTMFVSIQEDVTKQWLVRKQRSQKTGECFHNEASESGKRALDPLTSQNPLTMFQMPSGTSHTVVSRPAFL